MTNTSIPTQWSGGLPDPHTQAHFYQGVLFKKFIAWCLDAVFVFALAVLVSIFTLGIGFIFFLVLWGVLKFLYRFATLTTRSSTWGMRIMSIQYRRGDGEKFDGLTALLHTIGTAISFSTGIQIASVILMAVTPKGQGLIDLILGTTAINTPSRYT